MRAYLESRKSVRLNWFSQKDVPFISKYSLQWEYYQSSIQNNEISHTVYLQYQFEGLQNTVPNSNIIVFDNNGLPQVYLSTQGNVGKKMTTEKITENSILVKDRIVKYKKGEEKISSMPVPPHEVHLYKEIQIHEREDTIIRRINLHNESDRKINAVELKFLENKDIIFSLSKPEPNSADAPEYIWILNIDPEQSISVELTLHCKSQEVYKIKKDIPYSNSQDQSGFPQIQSQSNRL